MFRRLRLLGRTFISLGLFLLLARTGLLPEPAYQLLYEIAAAPGRLTGRGEKSAIRYFEFNCRPYRYPRSVLRLITHDPHPEGIERAVFTCSDARP
jgi:hypothetical protein